jgi:hypothetical protein
VLKGVEIKWQGHDPVIFPGQIRQLLGAPGPFNAAELLPLIVRVVSPGALMTCIRIVYLELMVQATRIAEQAEEVDGARDGGVPAIERMRCLCALQLQLSDILGKELPGAHAVFSEALEQVRFLCAVCCGLLLFKCAFRC